MNKVAEITFAFWIMKICATTLGETGGDLLSMTLNVGYGLSSIILISLFLLSLIWQLSCQRFHPLLYWSVILTTSTAGTTMSDFMDRTLALGYFKGALILLSLLMLVLFIWHQREKTISVNHIEHRSTELFYWAAILVSNTLGTALGDFLADDSGLGFFGGATVIGSLILLVAVLYYLTSINRVLLFWCAFVLTRPFGATFGDLLTKPSSSGGFDFGTAGSSAVLAGILSIFLLVKFWQHKRVLN